MFVKFLILFAVVFGKLCAQQHNCTNAYEPSKYIGETRVPTTCDLEQLDCPSSWKSGMSEGGEVSEPHELIDQQFLTCHESFSLCGYVPIVPISISE